MLGDGEIVCYVIRLFGGTHKWRRLRKDECEARGLVPGNLDHRICGRCGITRPIKQRGKP